MSEPDAALDGSRRADAIERVRAAGWDEGRDCDHCGGSGRVPGGRVLVHSRLGWLGADHDVESVVEKVQRADSCRWVRGFMGHDLLVVVDGKEYVFQVPRPEVAAWIEQQGGAR